jgi:tetratricopeptide (TPR) repeat protein
MPDAAAARGKAIDLLEKLVHEHPADLGLRKDLVDAYFLGGTSARPEVADQRFRRGVEQARELAGRNPANAETQAGLAQALTRYAGTLRARGRPAEAEPGYREALAILQRLPDAPAPSPANRNRLAEASYGLAELLRAADRFAEARPLYEQAIANQEAVLQIGSRNPTVRRQLAQQYDGLAKVLERLGEAEKAAEAARQATELRRQLDVRPPGRGGEPPPRPRVFVAPPQPPS